MVVKRVVGVEGDEVVVRKGGGVRRRGGGGGGGGEGGGMGREVVVPKGHVWVEGENPDPRFSRDSNTYGPVSTFLFFSSWLAGCLGGSFVFVLFGRSTGRLVYGRREC